MIDAQEQQEVKLRESPISSAPMTSPIRAMS